MSENNKWSIRKKFERGEVEDHNLIEYVGEPRAFYGTLLVVFLDGAEIECKNEDE